MGLTGRSVYTASASVMRSAIVQHYDHMVSDDGVPLFTWSADGILGSNRKTRAPDWHVIKENHVGRGNMPLCGQHGQGPRHNEVYCPWCPPKSCRLHKRVPSAKLEGAALGS